MIEPTDPRPASARPAPEPHAHAWGRMAFELADGHPVVHQRCEACGLVRRSRAWERYWSPSPATSQGDG